MLGKVHFVILFIGVNLTFGLRDKSFLFEAVFLNYHLLCLYRSKADQKKDKKEKFKNNNTKINI